MLEMDTAGRLERLGYPGLRAALGLGCLAGLAGGGLWLAVVAVTDRHLSAVSMIIGIFVGQAVMLGSGRRGGVVHQGLSVATTLTTLLVAEMFAIRLLAARQLVELGSTQELPILLPARLMWDLISAGLTADPPTALFWGVALWYAITIPRRRVEVGSGLAP